MCTPMKFVEFELGTVLGGFDPEESKIFIGTLRFCFVGEL